MLLLTGRPLVAHSIFCTPCLPYYAPIIATVPEYYVRVSNKLTKMRTMTSALT